MTYARYIYIWVGAARAHGPHVTTADLNVGRIGILVVLAIAAAKSTLVLLFFMHLLRRSGCC